MPFVPIDSPIRRIPTSLNRKEVLYLDGIRYCFEIFELVSLRLARTLHEIGQRDNASNPIAPLIVEATTDAWTLIDTTHRLRELLQQTPKLKKHEPELQVFLRRSKSIEKLRNYFQHFRTEIHSFADCGLPLWGTLSWVSGGDSSELPSNHCIIPGTFFNDCRAVGCTFDTHEGRFVERIVMHAGEMRIDLADLHDAVEQFVRFYIGWFEQTFNEKERHGADVHIRISLKPVIISKSNSEPAIGSTDQSQPLLPEIDPNSDENPSPQTL